MIYSIRNWQLTTLGLHTLAEYSYRKLTYRYLLGERWRRLREAGFSRSVITYWEIRELWKKGSGYYTRQKRREGCEL